MRRNLVSRLLLVGTALPLIVLGARFHPSPETNRPVLSSPHRSSEKAAATIAGDPVAALDFALHDAPEESREGLIRKLLQEWAKIDADAALSWVDRLDDEAERQSARSSVCLELAATDPRRAIELAVAHQADGCDTDALLENLTVQWTDRAPDSALDWVCQQPAGEWRDRLMARTAFVLAKTDPFLAASKVADEMQPGPVQTEAVLSVIYQWSMIDIEAAAGWVREFPAGALQDRALGEIANLRLSFRSPPAPGNGNYAP